jgi:hypothetical protein
MAEGRRRRREVARKRVQSIRARRSIRGLLRDESEGVDDGGSVDEG